MPRVLGIAELGEEVLLKRAEPVKDIIAPEIQELIGDMLATLKYVNGVGLAAPQVFRPLRIFVVHSHPTPRYPKAPVFGPEVMINPSFSVSPISLKERDWEGCLSIPGIRGVVSRYKEITARYQARDGQTKEIALEGFLARVFQHELDHLDGVLFISRVVDWKELATEKIWQNLKASS
jgi:peptide deformylase